MNLSSHERRSFLLLSNRFAGLASSRLVEACIQSLEARGARVVRHEPPSIAEARSLAREAARSHAFDAVVAAGGDGTIRQIAAELIGGPVPLVIVPGGTGNVLANEIGLARDPDAVADMLITGQTMPIPVGRANGEPFLLMASAGLDARVLQRLDPALKGRIGKAAYGPATLRALLHPLDALRVHVGGTTRTAAWAIIANARHYGGSFVLTRSTNIAQSGLVAVLFKSTSRARLCAQLVSLALGRLDPRAAQIGDVEIVPCEQAVIEADRAVPTQLDGDVFAQTPLRVETSDDVVHLVVPTACPLR